MGELLTLVVAAAGVFVATNLDDLLLVAALFGVARTGATLSAGQVVLGQAAGLGVLVAAGAVAAFGLLLVPGEVVGTLGLLPLALGLLAARRALAHEGEEPLPLLPATTGAGTVAGITIANGADNLAVYVPFFAATGAAGMAVVVVVFAVCLALLCVVAHRLAALPAVEAAVERWGAVAVPVVLVLLGIAVLVEAGTVPAALEALGLS